MGSMRTFVTDRLTDGLTDRAGFIRTLERVLTTVTCAMGELAERELQVVVYISGYIFGNLYRHIRRSTSWQLPSLQQKLSLLKAGKIDAVDSDDRYKLVKSRDRGGLWYVSDDIIVIMTEAEKVFKHLTGSLAHKISYAKLWRRWYRWLLFCLVFTMLNHLQTYLLTKNHWVTS